MDLERKQFKEVDLSDPFFDSLKSDYKEFVDWFNKKASEYAYVFRGSRGEIDGFLYLKSEDEVVSDVTPALPHKRRLKVGTFKINPHGTRLGERFMKKIFDHAISENVEEIYVTAFEKHKELINLFLAYGFEEKAEKLTSNGSELVLARNLRAPYIDVEKSYPIVRLGGSNIFLLALYPEWHTRLLPDSILKTENASIVQDVSHSNSIHKVYLTSLRGVEKARHGDVLLIYRTAPKGSHAPAHYVSVATSVCVLEEYRTIQSFSTKEEFLDYCAPYSVFSDEELDGFWRTKKYEHVIRFTYNIALPKRVTRQVMMEEIGLDGNERWGFMPLTSEQFIEIIRRGMVDESLIVD